MEDVKRYYIMESAVKPMSDGAPCCTPLVSAKTDLHIVPLVMGSDYDALLKENAELVAALELIFVIDNAYCQWDELAEAKTIAKQALAKHRDGK